VKIRAGSFHNHTTAVALRAGAMAIAGSQFISTGLKTHLEKYCSDFIGKVIAPSLVVHLLLNKVQSTALDELSSVMCLP
jgi:hypothetical protein